MNTTLATMRRHGFGRWLLALLAVAFACSGCQQTNGSGPITIRKDDGLTAMSAGDFKTMLSAYDTAMTDPKSAAARAQRDRLIFRIRVDIDGWYAALEQSLHENRAKFNTWTDFMELGLAGASALASQVDAKTRFATVLGVSKGTRLSYDKNWYGEKATESLINAMRTGRNLQLAEIIKKMSANGADRYTFEEAWGDLIAYYEAGTIQGALVTLSATTGTAATESEKTVKQASEPRYPVLVAATAAMVKETGEIGDKALALKPEQKRELLKALKVTVADDATDEKLADLVNELVQRLATATADERKKIIEAINKY